MKKLMLIMLILISTLSFGACSGSKYDDGKYTAESFGNGGDILIEANIENGKITDIKVLENDETPAMLKAVEETLIPQIISKQGVEEVDTVSGATKTSEAVIEAVGEILDQASK
ncbi:FMN-binding protein [Alkalibacter mobilis]|uniref:FMN-binding protein n=1 Tax=Alkalibacter mobilis TaxID=2787712 RepID=UPI0018A03C45|nr:FMN-binding protein [Alkalibacter mobilis]MBF7096451.1 FMN-binding protein [Alkalibacter mobilis]